MDINWRKAESGGWRQTLPSLKRKIRTQADRTKAYIYIGATEDPETRVGVHGRNDWPEMHIIFGTSSKGSAKNVERTLIDWARGTTFAPLLWNENRGGGGLRDGAERYWVYVLVD